MSSAVEWVVPMKDWHKNVFQSQTVYSAVGTGSRRAFLGSALSGEDLYKNIPWISAV